MAPQPSVVSVVLFIAIGLMVGMLLFWFAKRQIMRFTLKSARKPHITIGSDATKAMRDEIHRRLDSVQNVRYEPTMLTEPIQHAALSEKNHYFHRMKALDAFTNAVECCRSQDKSISLRSSKQTIQLYLFSLCPSVPGTGQARTIHQFCCAYNHARHSPAIFGDTEFINYMELLDKVIRMIKRDQKRRSTNSPEKPLVETQVRLRQGSSNKELAETVPHASTSKRPKAMLISPSASSTRPEPVEQISLVDKSSGYSSTDHSSSSKGSAERLISPHLSIMTKDDAV